MAQSFTQALKGFFNAVKTFLNLCNLCNLCQIFYLKQTGIISPLAKQYFSTNSGAIFRV
ncbi:hypothetical protein SAMN05444143_101629 [Flavobacterium succinicans]|jgi:hypothetical protein|uniref:Uncharacterized protein n=1 Tax=Flavobacterium succinicans TaxID=29536 RepID=A0A1I4S1W7_9FLAO|nr:hypothetical protein SAMN05444143_101629 [Flavobacterium succinicans]